MAVAVGGKGAILGFGEEITYGTAVTLTKFIELVSGGLTLDKGKKKLKSAAINSFAHKLTSVADVNTLLDGDPTFEVRYEGLELIFKHALGQVTTTQPDVTNDPDVYQHVFEMIDDMPTGLTMGVDLDTNELKGEGCKITSLNLAVTNEGFLICSLGIIGEDGVLGSVTSSTLSTKALITFATACLKWDTGEVDQRACSVNLANPFERRFFNNGVLTKEPYMKGKRVITGDFDKDFEDTTLWNAFVAGTNKALQIKSEGSVIAGGSDSYKYTVQVDVPIAVLMDANPAIADEGAIPQVCTYEGFESGADKPIKITVINTVSSV